MKLAIKHLVSVEKMAYYNDTVLLSIGKWPGFVTWKKWLKKADRPEHISPWEGAKKSTFLPIIP